MRIGLSTITEDHKIVGCNLFDYLTGENTNEKANYKDKANCGRVPSIKVCPTENGLTKGGGLPPDPDACISCPLSVWEGER